MENIEVSDHAIVRYFERIIGFNIEELKETILQGDFERVVRNNKVITVYPNDSKWKPRATPKKVVPVKEKGKRLRRDKNNSCFSDEYV